MKNYSFVGAGALAVAVLLSNQAIAQQSNPLSDLLGTIQKIAVGPARLQTGATQLPQPGVARGGDLTDDILQTLGARFKYETSQSSCRFYPEQADEIDLAQRTGKFLDAATRAKLQASHEAACALNNFGLPLSQAKTQVGELLALAAINYSRAGMVSDDTLLDAKHAIALLKLDQAANGQLIAKLEDTFWPKGPIADTKAFATMTSVEAATKYQQNTFAFERTFTGKTLQIKGRVLSVSGSDKNASIRLEGVKREADQRSWRDTIYCDIKDNDAMDAAAKISQGDTVSVLGVVHKGLLPGVSLADCRLVR